MEKINISIRKTSVGFEVVARKYDCLTNDYVTLRLPIKHELNRLIPFVFEGWESSPLSKVYFYQEGQFFIKRCGDSSATGVAVKFSSELSPRDSLKDLEVKLLERLTLLKDEINKDFPFVSFQFP